MVHQKLSFTFQHSLGDEASGKSINSMNLKNICYLMQVVLLKQRIGLLVSFHWGQFPVSLNEHIGDSLVL